MSNQNNTSTSNTQSQEQAAPFLDFMNNATSVTTPNSRPLPEPPPPPKTDGKQ